MTETPANQTSQPTLALVRGWPGSGKSTLARTHLPSFHQREADMHLVDKEGRYHFTPKRASKAHEKCQREVKGLLTAGEDVVVCNTMLSKISLSEYFSIAASTTSRVCVIECSGEFRNVHRIPSRRVAEMRLQFSPAYGHLAFSVPVVDATCLGGEGGGEEDIRKHATLLHCDLLRSGKSTRGKIWPSSITQQIKVVAEALKDLSPETRPGCTPIELKVCIKLVGRAFTVTFRRHLFGGMGNWVLTGIHLSTPSAMPRNKMRLLRKESAELTAPYRWLKAFDSRLRFIGCQDQATPNDTAMELLGIVELMRNAPSIEESAAALESLAIRRRADEYGVLVPARSAF